ncbi:hypothetical protein HY989_03250 [Candidatus Micrarchaeota archaeon]|nr:hypothetical protein [Candidatus Micrarchaeota archaeon]
MKVLLDTNFLLLPFENHVDVFEEVGRLLNGKVEFLVLANTLRELKDLKGRHKLYGRAMIEFIARQTGKFEIIKMQGKTDNMIVEYSNLHNSPDYYVATMDRKLKESLKKLKVKVIILKDKGRIDFA